MLNSENVSQGKHIVAVYGSLRRGFGNSGFLDGQKYLGDDRTTAEYTMVRYCSGFPAVVPNGKHSVWIEVYEVDDKTASRLDRLEGVPSFYQRHTIPTKYGEACMYVINGLNTDEYEVIEDGIWKRVSNGGW